MKSAHWRKVVLIWLVCLAGLWEVSFSLPKTQPDYCQLQGAVFIEPVAGFADYRVFVQEVESFANLVVYKEPSEAFANQPGMWFITDTKAFSDFSIFIEDVEAFSDFTIAYTPFRNAAGCQ